MFVSITWFERWHSGTLSGFHFVSFRACLYITRLFVGLACSALLLVLWVAGPAWAFPIYTFSVFTPPGGCTVRGKDLDRVYLVRLTLRASRPLLRYSVLGFSLFEPSRNILVIDRWQNYLGSFVDNDACVNLLCVYRLVGYILA